MKQIFLTRFFCLVSCVLCLVSALSAQQEAQYSMYHFNGLYLNPAYAGSHDVLNTMAIYRQQWVKIPGAPQSASVAAHSPLKNDNIALGVIYNYDKISVTQTHDVSVDFAYRIRIGKKKLVRLSFGISAGATNYRSDLSAVATTETDDPHFANNVNRWLPNVGAGIYAYSDKFFAGVSVPRILANRLDKTNSVFEISTDVAHQYYHLFMTGGYVFSLGKKVKFVPSILLKYAPASSPITFDFNANFVLIDRIWIGASYRFNDSYSFMLAANVTKQLRIGYSYDLTISGLSRFTSGSHEVMASYDFVFAHKKVVSPRQIKYF